MDIILASQSPRRKELLSQMGLRGFKVTSPEVDETVEEHLPPAQVVEELSRRKALAGARHADQDDLIIAADTVVALEGAVLGKPADQREAFAMLSALSGNRHYVYTGLTVIQGDQVVTQHECTTVTFRELEPVRPTSWRIRLQKTRLSIRKSLVMAPSPESLRLRRPTMQ